MEVAVHKVHLAIHRAFVAMGRYRGSALRLIRARENLVFDIIQIPLASGLHVIASRPGRWTRQCIHGVLDMAHVNENEFRL